jgi:hypothetical protein
MRAWGRTSGLLAALLGVGLVAGCGGSSGPAVVPSSQVARAAYQTAKGPGFKFVLLAKVSLSGQSVALRGEGEFDERNNRGAMTISVGTHGVEEILDNPTIYVHTPNSPGKPWISANLNVYNQASGASNQPPTDPSHILDLLKGSGHISRVGPATVRGVPTVHYHALVDLDRYAQALPAAQRTGAKQYAAVLKRVTGTGSLPMDAFIDHQGHVRREQFALSVCTAKGKATGTIQLDLFDYGPQTAPPPPPADQVTDISGKLRDEVAGELHQTDCS